MGIRKSFEWKKSLNALKKQSSLRKINLSIISVSFKPFPWTEIFRFLYFQRKNNMSIFFCFIQTFFHSKVIPITTITSITIITSITSIKSITSITTITRLQLPIHILSKMFLHNYKITRLQDHKAQCNIKRYMLQHYNITTITINSYIIRLFWCYNITTLQDYMIKP